MCIYIYIYLFIYLCVVKTLKNRPKIRQNPSKYPYSIFNRVHKTQRLLNRRKNGWEFSMQIQTKKPDPKSPPPAKRCLPWESAPRTTSSKRGQPWPWWATLSYQGVSKIPVSLHLHLLLAYVYVYKYTVYIYIPSIYEYIYTIYKYVYTVGGIYIYIWCVFMCIYIYTVSIYISIPSIPYIFWNH